MECCSLLYWLLDDDGARRDVVRKCRKSLFLYYFLDVADHSMLEVERFPLITLRIHVEVNLISHLQITK